MQYKYREMKANNTLNSNPYIDEVAANVASLGASAAFRSAQLSPGTESLEDTKAASATDNAEAEYEHDLEDLVEGDAEFELEKEVKSDDFSSHNPYKDRHGGQNKDQEQKQDQKKQRRLGKVQRKESPQPTREEVFKVLEGLDKVLNAAQEASKTDGSEKEFENWNNWFKAEKKAPPAPDSSKVFYIREEYNTKRSPHLWKTNPNKKWVLAFGENDTNNVVSANLFKYQNDTISKDA